MTAPSVSAAPDPVKVPARRSLPRLARDPMRAFEQVGRDSDGALTRLHLGLIRPYLVTHPDHVQQVLRNHETYEREGMLWKPIQRLEGDGIAGVGAAWRTSRRLLQPLFTMRHLRGLLDTMAAAVEEALDRLAAPAAGGQPVDLAAEMMRVTQRVMVRVFFGDRISAEDSDRLGRAIAAAFDSLGWRMLLPFMPNAFPMPGDRTFRRAVRIADEVIYPLVRESRSAPAGDDLVTHFVQAVDEDGDRLDEQRIRDDLVGMFVAGTETTALTLTWLLLVLDRHPQVAARLTEEVADVVGDGPPEPSHLDKLVYTRMALQETLRLFPAGWILPRTVTAADELGGVRLSPGTTVILSPYLTHRLPAFWDDPLDFDPERFTPERVSTRHRFAYLPFGAGAHQCLGNHFSLMEGQLVMAGLLSRWRPEIVPPPGVLAARPTASLRPRTHADMLLRPRR